MAEPNNDNTKVKYKFGTSELPLDLYIKNLKDNYQSYIDSRNWSDGQKAEFKGAFDNYIRGFEDQLDNNTSRFSTDYTGTVFDNNGLITEKDSDDFYYDSKGNQYTSEQYNKFKPKQQKNYSVFNANRQAASYLNIIGKALRDKLNSTTSSTSASSKFDYNTNGFARWYKNKYQPLNEQLDFNANKELDKNEDGGYNTTKRAASLNAAIGEYINSLSDDLDYSELGGKDKYVENLKAAMKSLEDGYSAEDITALRQLIGDDFIKAYFDTSTGTTEQGQKSSTQQALAETQARIAEINEEQSLEQARQRLAELEKQQARKLAFNNYRQSNSFTPKLQDFKRALNQRDINTADMAATRYYHKQIFNDEDYIPDSDYSQKVLQYLNEHNIVGYDNNPTGNVQGLRFFSSLINSVDNFKGSLNTYREGYNTYYIIPGSFNKANYSVKGWNSTNYQLKEIPVEKLNASLQDEYLYNNDELWNSDNSLFTKDQRRLAQQIQSTLATNKQGGILKAQNGYYLNKLRAKSQKKERLEESDTRTPEEKTAGARTLSDGLTGTDLTRLGAIGADIVSAISSFVPGYGTAVSAVSGIGSTVATTIADMVEDGIQWSDIGNGLLGLGMDVAGLLPGIGTGAKFTKIGKQLIKYAPLVLGYLQAKNALSEPAIASWNKISNGEFSELTVDDLRNIASGITLVTSGANQAGIRLKNSAMKEVAKTGDLKIETKTGEMAKITPEKLDELKKAKTLEEQNKILQSVPGNEGKELKSRVRGSWNPSRLYNNNPSIADDYDWSKLRDVEKSWSDASIFKGVRSATVNPNIHINIKNPYTRTVTVTTNTPTPASLKNGKYKQLHSELENDPYYGGTDPEEFKQGGSLNVSKVRKMANGDSTPVVSPDWYNTRWEGGTALMGWNNNLDWQNSANTNINNIHHYKADTLNDVFASNQAYTSNHNAVQSDLQGYYNSDFASTNTNINTFIQRYNEGAAKLRSFFDTPLTYNNRGAISHNQLFKKMFASRSAVVDNTNKEYALGYDENQQDIVGSTTWARRMDQYETEFDELLDETAKATRTYDIKIGNETYKVYKKANGDIALLSNDKSSEETTPAAPVDTSKRTGVRTEGEGNGNNNNLTSGKSKVLINPAYLYGLPRAIMSDRDNRRMTDLAKSIIKPVLTDPIESYKYTRSDLNEEINGEQAKAAIVNAASQPLTSDASYEAARRLAAEVKGDEYKLQGLQKSDQVRDTYDEQNWQLQQQNAQNRHEVAMANRKGMAAAQYNKSIQELAYMSKKNNIWDTYGQQVEYEAASKYQKAKAAQEKMLLSAIQKDVYYNPANYGILLTPEQQEIWEETLKTGTVPSDDAKQQQYLVVYNKLQEKIKELAAAQYGFTYIPVNQEILNTSWTPPSITTKIDRLGGKLAKGGRTSADYIAVAGIQARTSDANRFQRQIKATIDRNEKTIDRLARSMYDLIKLAK